MRLRRATARDAEDLAAFIIERCGAPERHCLSSWTGESREACVARQRRQLEAGALYELAVQGRDIVGALGCRVDPEAAQLWLEGPHLAQHDDALAQLLWEGLLERLPSELREAAAVVDVRNELAQTFWACRGLLSRGSVQIFEWPAAVADEPYVALQLHPSRAEHAQQIEVLLDACALRGRPSSARLASGELQSLVALDVRGTVVGLSSAALHAAGEGQIAHLAVRPDHRRHGIGRQLLLGAMALLQHRGAERVLLSVSDDAIEARALYESVGFQLLSTGVSMRGTICRPSAPGSG